MLTSYLRSVAVDIVFPVAVSRRFPTGRPVRRTIACAPRPFRRVIYRLARSSEDFPLASSRENEPTSVARMKKIGGRDFEWRARWRGPSIGDQLVIRRGDPDGSICFLSLGFYLVGKSEVGLGEEKPNREALSRGYFLARRGGKSKCCCHVGMLTSENDRDGG